MSASASPSPPAIELVGIDKRFGEVHANKAVDLTVGGRHDPRHRGRERGRQVDADVDPVRLLRGRRRRDPGCRASGAHPRPARGAIAAGIGMVHQHFMLVENFTVLDNVMLGAEGGALLGKGVEEARAKLKPGWRRTTPSRSTRTR
jgi:ABC-type sugar transport system ATPase subunit